MNGELACEPTMGDPLELVGKRMLLLIDDGRSASDSEPEKAAWARDWLRGTVQAVSVIGLSAPEVSGGDATSTSSAGGLTVSVYIQVQRCRMATFDLLFFSFFLELPSFCSLVKSRRVSTASKVAANGS